MAERSGKIVNFNTTNRMGQIQPIDGGPVALFYLPQVTNAEPFPKKGDTVSFDAPEVRKNKQGKSVQGNATAVTITERGPDLPPERPKPERRPAGRRDRSGSERSGGRGERRPPRLGRDRDDRSSTPRPSRDRFNRGDKRELSRDEIAAARRSRPRRERFPKSGENHSPRREGRVKARSSATTTKERPLNGVIPIAADAFPMMEFGSNISTSLVLDKLILWPRPGQAKSNSDKAAGLEQVETKPTYLRFSEKNKRYFFSQHVVPSFRQVQTQHSPHREVVARWNRMLDGLSGEGVTVLRAEWSTVSRLAVGLSKTGVISQGSIALDPLFGYPVIPGAALKGRLSRYLKARQDVSQELRERIFGSRSKPSVVTFFDAIPARRITRLDVDERSSHSPRYFLGDGVPSDRVNPQGVVFLSLPPGVGFRFAIAVESEDAAELAPQILAFLRESLMDSGVGANANIGYGRFEDLALPLA